MKDFDITYISTTKSLKKPLTRQQFVEFIVRIATEKYLKNNMCSNVGEALNMLLSGDMLEVVNDVEDPQYWRDTRFWKAEVDDYMIEKQGYLRWLFKSFSGQIRKQNSKYIDGRFITLQEFKRLFDCYELINEDFKERDIINAFILS